MTQHLLCSKDLFIERLVLFITRVENVGTYLGRAKFLMDK